MNEIKNINFEEEKYLSIFAHLKNNAQVAELVDALDSKSSGSDIVRVRFPPWVQYNRYFYLQITYYSIVSLVNLTSNLLV